jgi:hypothetical protein
MNYFIEQEVLENLKDSTLFYPCSGSDIIVPIRLFSPYVNEFWFVDRGYFTPGHQDTRSFGMDVAADEREPFLKDEADYEFITKSIVGPPSSTKRRNIEPCILTEHYRHIPTNRTIKIHLRRGYGFSAFRNEISSLGVFFYRGDSPSEGGSGNLWMAPDHLREIFLKLINGGLIVTDGSNHSYYRGKSGEYKEFWKQNEIKEHTHNPLEIIGLTKPFLDKSSRNFTCVGYAGHRYGPTLAWKVN